ncbi:MAG: hypothetical protein ACRDZ4_11025 [Egibacteraceae bacterium]
MAHATLTRRLNPEATMRNRLLFLLVTAAGLVAVAFKRQRSRELDEAIWEEPSDL